MKITLSEIKKILQGNNSGEDEAKNQINYLGHKEEKSIQSEQQEEKSIQKNENRIRSLWDISKGTDIQIIGLPEGVEEEQEIEILFEQIMKGTSTIWQRKQTSRESRKLRVSQRSWTQGGTHQRHIIITLAKIKDKERILKAAREKDTVPTKEFP